MMSSVILTILLSTFFFLASSQCTGLESKEYVVENEGIIISLKNSTTPEISVRHYLKPCSGKIMYCNTSDDGTITIGVSIMCTTPHKTTEYIMAEITITNTSVTLSGTQEYCPVSDSDCPSDSTATTSDVTWTLKPINHDLFFLRYARQHFFHFGGGPHLEEESTFNGTHKPHNKTRDVPSRREHHGDDRWSGDRHNTFASFEDPATVEDSENSDDNDTVSDNDLDVDNADQADDQQDLGFGQPRNDFQWGGPQQRGQGSRPFVQSNNNNRQWQQQTDNGFNNPNFGGGPNNWGGNNQDSNPWSNQGRGNRQF